MKKLTKLIFVTSYIHTQEPEQSHRTFLFGGPIFELCRQVLLSEHTLAVSKKEKEKKPSEIGCNE